MTHLARLPIEAEPDPKFRDTQDFSRFLLRAECRRPFPNNLHSISATVTTPYKLHYQGKRQYVSLGWSDVNTFAGAENIPLEQRRAMTDCKSGKPLHLQASMPRFEWDRMSLSKAQRRKVLRTLRKGSRLRVEYRHRWTPSFSSSEGYSRLLGVQSVKVSRLEDLPRKGMPDLSGPSTDAHSGADDQAARWTARVTRLERRASGKYPLRVTMRSSRKATLTGSVYGVVTTTRKMKVLGRNRYIPLATFGYMKGASFPQARLNARRDLGGLPTHMQRIDEPDVKSEDLVGRFGAMPLNAAQKRAADRALRRGKRLRVRLYEAVAPDVHSADLQYRRIRTQVITVRR